jgi:hypothetical protein
MNRRLRWIGAAGAFASVCLSASVLLARQGVIRTRDGRTMEGDIEEKPDQVTITIRGIRTSVSRDNIEGPVEYFDNVEARYQDRVSKLPKNPTAEDRLAVARWLLDVKQYDLAQKEIDEARKIDPNSAAAATLEQTVVGQRRLDKSRAAGTSGGGTGSGPSSTPRPPANTPGAGTGGTPPPPAGSGEKPHYLTAEDINIIRQAEWRENDNVAPRATVPADVRKRYIDLKALNSAEFANLSLPQQAYLILSDPDTPAELRQKIKLTTDPQTIADYRRTVQPLVLNNCATAGCHASKNAGDFMLYANNPEREDVAYTNFYILQTYARNNGENLMIDRTYPDRSLLAQYALHPDSAEIDHPPLKGQAYRAMALNKSAPAYVTLVNWMKELRAGDPKYGIKYELPGGGKPKPEAGGSKPATGTPATGTPPTGTTPPPAGTAKPPTTPAPGAPGAAQPRPPAAQPPAGTRPPTTPAAPRPQPPAGGNK